MQHEDVGGVFGAAPGNGLLAECSCKQPGSTLHGQETLPVQLLSRWTVLKQQGRVTSTVIETGLGQRQGEDGIVSEQGG